MRDHREVEGYIYREMDWVESGYTEQEKDEEQRLMSGGDSHLYSIPCQGQSSTGGANQKTGLHKLQRGSNLAINPASHDLRHTSYVC